MAEACSKWAGHGQLLRKLPGKCLSRPETMSETGRSRIILAPADLETPLLGLACSTASLEGLNQLAIRSDAAESGTEAGHVDGRGLFRQGVNPCVLGCVGAPVVVYRAALPEPPDQFHCLFEQLHSHIQRRPAVSQDVLCLWLPDLWILVHGEPQRGVGVLMPMHLAIAFITYNALVRTAPVPRQERPGARLRS